MVAEKRIKKGMYWDRAWALVEGCTPVDESCEGCWAAEASYMRQFNPAVSYRHEGLTNEQGRFNGTIRLMEQDLEKPVHTRKEWTWAIWNDLFHEKVPLRFIADALDIMALESCEHQTFLILTKRPEHSFLALTKRAARVPFFFAVMREAGEVILPAVTLPNLWVGVTVPMQKYVIRLEHLLQYPGKRYVSIEPCLGEVDLRPYLPYLHGVILGGESGPRARPMHPDWARKVRDDCAEFNVPFFFKQWGEWCPDDFTTVTPGGRTPKRAWVHHTTGEAYDWAYPYNCEGMMRVGRNKAGRLLDGREHNDLAWN